jgi:chorismate dehydratase
VLRLGQIPYLNCEPFFAHLSGFQLVPLTPRRLGRTMAQGAVDAAPLSLADFLAQEDSLLPLPFGIATDGPARSVILFSHCQPAELADAVIGVSDETSTSVEILRLLLTLRYHAVPRAWVSADEPCDAVLLIGDSAIRAVTTNARFPHALDLGREWKEWTRLPCVFARWAVRRAIPAAERLALERALDAALDRGIAAIPEIAARRRDTGFTEAEVGTYLRGFTYRFGAAEAKAIAEFRRLRSLL